MRFKLIMALVDNSETDAVLDAGRRAGATGATIITSCRGEGLQPEKTFLGLSLTGTRDILLFLVEEHLSRAILEEIATVGAFEERSGTGIAFQIAIEDAVGLSHQIEEIQHEIEDQI
jgi:nitrogen regulatory protein PII